MRQLCRAAPPAMLGHPLTLTCHCACVAGLRTRFAPLPTEPCPRCARAPRLRRCPCFGSCTRTTDYRLGQRQQQQLASADRAACRDHEQLDKPAATLQQSATEAGRRAWSSASRRSRPPCLRRPRPRQRRGERSTASACSRRCQATQSHCVSDMLATSHLGNTEPDARDIHAGQNPVKLARRLACGPIPFSSPTLVITYVRKISGTDGLDRGYLLCRLLSTALTHAELKATCLAPLTPAMTAGSGMLALRVLAWVAAAPAAGAAPLLCPPDGHRTRVWVSASLVWYDAA